MRIVARMTLVCVLLLSMATAGYGQSVDFTLQSAATTGNGADMRVHGLSVVLIAIIGTSGADRVVSFQAAQAGLSTPQALQCTKIDDGTTVTSITASGTTPFQVRCPVSGFSFVRAPVSGGSTGSVTVTATALANVSMGGGGGGGGGSGTVTSVATGSGLTGGPVTTTGTLDLANVAATSHQWFDSVVGNVLHKSQPACADISNAGTVCTHAATDFEVPLTFENGLTRSANTIDLTNVAATSHQWFDSVASNILHKSQPASADLSDTANIPLLNASQTFSAVNTFSHQLFTSTGPVKPFTSSPSLTQNHVAEAAGWSWFMDPRAIAYKGTKDQTYVAYTTPAGAVTVTSIDRVSGAVVSTVVGTDSIHDDHSAPSLYISTAGKILVFWACQGTCPDQGINEVISTNAEDVSAFGAVINPIVRTGTDFVSYTNPRYLSSEGKLYLFYRDYQQAGSPRYQYAFITSSDEGATWSAATNLFNQPFSNGLDQRNYVKVIGNGTNRFDFAVTDLNPDDNPGITNNVYHMYYTAGHYFDSTGVDLGSPPFTPATSALTKVYDGSAVQGWIWQIGYDAGKPVILFERIVSSAHNEYWYAYWTGSAWSNHLILDGGNSIYGTPSAQPGYAGGVELNQTDPSMVWASASRDGTTWQMQRCATPDHGTTWTCVPLTKAASGTKQWRPVFVWNSQNGQAVWNSGTYTTYTTWTGVLVNDGDILGPSRELVGLWNASQPFTSTKGIGASATPGGTLVAQLMPAVAVDNSTNFLRIVGTMPAVPTGTVEGLYISITGAGTASQSSLGILIDYAAGYTGSSKTVAFQAQNENQGTGTNLNLSAGAAAPLGNTGIAGFASGVTVGVNTGGVFEAETGSTNIAVLAKAVVNKASAKNIGIAAFALNTSSSPIEIAGYFGLQNATPTFASAAIVADNGTESVSVALFRVNGTTTMQINNAGDLADGAHTRIVHGGAFTSSDGTAGATTTCTIAGLTSIVVKDGLIVSCS